MAKTIALEAYRNSFLAVLATVVEHSRGYFLEPEASLFETLASVSAAEASRPIGAAGTTLAAQVDHVRFYIATRNDELSGGEDRPVDWAAAWQAGTVTDVEWQGLVEGLRAAYKQFLAFARTVEDWDEPMIADAFALLGHCAYHLGEIRQTLGVLRQPGTDPRNTATAACDDRARPSAKGEKREESPMTEKHQHGSTSTSRLIKAPPETVYHACTDPTMLAQWRPPEGMTGQVHRFDLRVGGEYEMSLYYSSADDAGRGKTAAQEDRFVARFVELAPPHKIIESITFDATDPMFTGPMQMEVSLAAVDGNTLVTITFKGLPVGIHPEDNELGTRMALDKLAALVERAGD